MRNYPFYCFGRAGVTAWHVQNGKCLHSDDELPCKKKRGGKEKKRRDSNNVGRARAWKALPSLKRANLKRWERSPLFDTETSRVLSNITIPALALLRTSPSHNNGPRWKLQFPVVTQRSFRIIQSSSSRSHPFPYRFTIKRFDVKRAPGSLRMCGILAY